MGRYKVVRLVLVLLLPNLWQALRKTFRLFTHLYIQ